MIDNGAFCLEKAWKRHWLMWQQGKIGAPEGYAGCYYHTLLVKSSFYLSSCFLIPFWFLHRATMKFKGKAVANFFFKQLDSNDKSRWTCNKCGEPRSSPRGYTNLTDHLPRCIGEDWEAQMESHLKKHGIVINSDGSFSSGKRLSQKAISSFVSTGDNELRCFNWMRWLAVRNMPLSEIDNPLTVKW